MTFWEAFLTIPSFLWAVFSSPILVGLVVFLLWILSLIVAAGNTYDYRAGFQDRLVVVLASWAGFIIMTLFTLTFAIFLGSNGIEPHTWEVAR